MLEKIMDLVRSQVTETIGGMPGVPEDKKSDAVNATAHSLVDGLKNYASPENLPHLTSMLGIGKSGGAGASTGGMATSLESGVVSALTSKVGLSPSVAQKIASTVIPAVMSLFKKKIDDGGEPGFNLESLVGGLTGKSSGGGVMGMLGGLLGRKG